LNWNEEILNLVKGGEFVKGFRERDRMTFEHIQMVVHWGKAFKKYAGRGLVR